MLHNNTIIWWQLIVTWAEFPHLSDRWAVRLIGQGKRNSVNLWWRCGHDQWRDYQPTIASPVSMVTVKDATTTQHLHHLVDISIGRSPGQVRRRNSVIPVVSLLKSVVGCKGHFAQDMLDSKVTQQYNHMVTTHSNVERFSTLSGVVRVANPKTHDINLQDL